jgi:arylesterase/paraoxonase
MTRLNNSGRSKTDHFSVLSLDTPGADGLHNLRTLKTSGYSGTRGDNVLDLHGFDVDVIGGNALRLWAVNHRPPLDPVTGSEVDAAIVGANSTVEVFEIERHGDTLQHIETYADALIQTPNRVTPTGENGFVMTNDKSVKGKYIKPTKRACCQLANSVRRIVGFRRELDLFVGGGFLVHCQSSFCQRAIPADQTLKYPNGIIRNIHDGLYYVPSSADGRIYVYSLMPQGTLSHVDTIFVGQPMDNLSVDSKGDIFAAAFPKALAVFKSFDDPHGTQVPSAVFRIRREEGGYVVHKVIEDRDSEALNMVTGVVHDVKTGRLWAGGVHAPFITVCEPK